VVTSPPATALVLFVAIAFAPSAKGAEASYRVRVEAADPLRINVQARLVVSDGTLSLAGWGADQMPNGWASFIRDLLSEGQLGLAVAMLSGTDRLPVKESLGLAGYRAYTQYYDGELYLVPKTR
jgi:hypothetical protein